MTHRNAENRLPPRPNGAFVWGVIAWIILVIGLVGWGLGVAS